MAKEKPIVRRRKVAPLVCGTLYLFAFLLALIPIVMSITHAVKKSSYIKTQAIITKVVFDENNENDEVLISYTINDGIFENVPLNFSTEWMKEGQKLTIYVNPNDYSDIYQEPKNYFIILIGTVGFSVPATVILIVDIVIKRRQQQLKKQVKPIVCKIIYVKEEMDVIGRFSRNRRAVYYGYAITCMPLKMDSTKLYKSEHVHRPEQDIKNMLIDVYVNPTNSKKYYVDLTSIRVNVDGEKVYFKKPENPFENNDKPIVKIKDLNTYEEPFENN